MSLPYRWQQALAASVSMVFLASCQAPLPSQTSKSLNSQATQQDVALGQNARQLLGQPGTTFQSKSILFKKDAHSPVPMQFEELLKPSKGNQPSYSVASTLCGMDPVPEGVIVGDISYFWFPHIFDSKEAAESALIRPDDDGDGYPYLIWSPTQVTVKNSDVGYFRFTKFPNGDIFAEAFIYACFTNLSPVDLKVAYPAFSPNNDGHKDDNDILVLAAESSNWELTLDGYNVKRTGSGNETISWKDFVNGIILPDGKYTLRLTAGSEVKTAEVIIDKKKPIIVSSIPKSIETTNEDLNTNSLKFRYNFLIEAKDEGAAPSGIAPASVRFPVSAPMYAEIGSSSSVGANTYSINVVYDLDATREPLNYQAVVEDAAGNLSDPFITKYSQTYEAALSSGLADYENVIANGGSVGSAYKIMEVPNKVYDVRVREDNFYIKSKHNYHLRGPIGTADSRFPPYLNIAVVCINKFVGKGQILDPKDSIWKRGAGYLVTRVTQSNLNA